MFIKQIIPYIPLVQILIQIFIGLLGVTITILWQRYRKRKNYLEFMRFRWAEQQQINLAILNNPETSETFEKMVYGSGHQSTSENNRRIFLVFLHLNQILHLYLAKERKLLKQKEFERLATITLRLFARERCLVEFALKNRGYGENFSKAIIKLYENIEPYQFINWDDYNQKSETK